MARPPEFGISKLHQFSTCKSLSRTLFLGAALCLSVFAVWSWQCPHDWHHLAILPEPLKVNVELDQVALGQQRHALELIKLANSSFTTSFPKVGSDPLFCAAFIANNHAQHDHLGEAVGSLLQGLTDEERRKVYVAVLFADINSGAHPQWNSQWMGQLVDAAGRYTGLTEMQMLELEAAEEMGDVDLKSLLDYVYLSERCLDTGAEYVAIFHDDMIFSDGWLSQTMCALTRLKETNNASGATSGMREPWLYLDLSSRSPSHPTAGLRRSDADEWLIFLGAVLAVYAVSLRLRRQGSGVRRKANSITAVLFSIVFTAAAISLFLTQDSGFAVLSDSTAVTPIHNLTQHVQSAIYPNYRIKGLAKYLREKHEGHVDVLVSDYLKEEGMVRYALTPGVVRRAQEEKLEVDAGRRWEMV